MKILPNLNLNKHPQECTDGSLINANNIIVSSDNAVIQNEPELVNSDVNKLLKEYYKDIAYKIIYILSCNKEIVIFVKPDNIEDISLIRYNEKFNKIQYCTDIDYSGGKFVGTFTYNKTNLIIAFSEYSEDDSLNIPLRTINLGEFDKEIDEDNKNQLINKDLHSIVPKVIIPSVEYTFTEGNTNKGWYFIFIRYKISRDTYTQWYDTHCKFLLDTYQSKEFFHYNFISNPSNNSGKRTVVSYTDLSEESDYVPLSFQLNSYNLDYNYKEYQLGIIIVKKGKTIVEHTEDIDILSDIDKNIYKYDKSTIIKYSLDNILVNYNNYYNVKAINIKENKLYISDYKENNQNIVEDLKDITVSITPHGNRVNYPNIKNEDNGNGGNGGDGGISENGTIYEYYNGTQYGPIKSYVINGKHYVRGTQFFYHATINDEYRHGVILDCNTTDILTISYEASNDATELSHITIKAEELYISYYDWEAPCDSTIYEQNNKSTYTVRGKLYRLENNQLVSLLPDAAYIPYRWTGDTDMVLVPDITIDAINGNEFGDGSPTGVKYAKRIIGMRRTYPKDYTFYVELDYDFSYIIPGTISTRSLFDPSKLFQPFNTYNYPNNVLYPFVFSDQLYNFFIHFVDEYGISTKGYNINNFKINYPRVPEAPFPNIWYKKENKLNNMIIAGSIDISAEHYPIFAMFIDFIPKQYVGWFISYEKLQKRQKITSYYETFSASESSNKIILYNIEYNFLINDNIDFDFDRVTLYKCINITGDIIYGNPENARNIYNEVQVDYSDSKTYKVINKEYRVADSYGNILTSTNIVLTLKNLDDTDAVLPINLTLDGKGLAVCFKADVSSLYNNKNKVLIPCSKVCYETNSFIEVNTCTGFFDINETHFFKDVYFDPSSLNYKQNSTNTPITKVFSNLKWGAKDELPYNYKIINNKPNIIAFPIAGLNTTDVYNKAYEYGYAITVQNTIDLFAMPHYVIGDAYPKTLDWYNPDIKNIYEYPKTIRRSSIIQDENNINYWRQFPIESYKTISENKGDVIKIIPIGNLLLVHTQYSLFMFNGADSIKSQNSEDNSNNNIQLASIDIWDIDYKEILTSTYGRAGLSKQEHSIVGDFGYIWYDYESRRIYRFDNNSIIAIDDNIKNFIYKLKGFDLNIIEDINRNRLLFNFYKKDISYILSYNYNINSFVSLHSYEYSIGYNTKNNIYIVTKDNIIKDFNDNFYDTEIYTNYRDTYNNSSINIICNTDFSKMKSIDSIVYNIRKVVNKTINDFLPVERLDNYYAGDSIRIYNSLFDTGLIDISNNNKNNVNEDYKKPYWRLGNWHFNNIRNSLLEAKDSRIYGNYFIIQFNFNTNKQIEIESIDVKLNNSTLR